MAKSETDLKKSNILYPDFEAQNETGNFLEEEKAEPTLDSVIANVENALKLLEAARRNFQNPIEPNSKPDILNPS